MPQSCFRRGATPQPPRLHSFSFPVQSPAAAAHRCHGAGAARAPSFGSASRRYCWSSSALLMPNLLPLSSTTSLQRPIQSPPSSPKRRGASPFRRRGYAPSCRSKASATCQSSPKGPMGLMVIPEAWAALRSRYGLGADPYDAHDNILPVLPIVPPAVSETPGWSLRGESRA